MNGAERTTRLFASALAVILAVVLDIVGLVCMFSEEWVKGLALSQTATFLILFAIWIDG